MTPQELKNRVKRCKSCINTSSLKDSFFSCHYSFRKKLSTSMHHHQQDQANDYFNMDEEEEFVSSIVSKYMESKCRRKANRSNFFWAYSPTTGESFMTENETIVQENEIEENKEEKFYDVGNTSHISRCSSAATTMEAYVSVKSSFSRSSSSLNRFDLPYLLIRRRRLIFHEFRHCEGWPFGLCRKALLLPPLPKSPSDSWSWRKNGRIINSHCHSKSINSTST